MDTLDQNAEPGARKNSNEESLTTIAHVVYALQAVGVFLQITLLIAVIINYVKRDDAAGTWLASHFRWQIRTFWFFLLWVVLGFITWIILIGMIIIPVAYIWLIYRIIKGWLYLVDRKPMYPEQAV